METVTFSFGKNWTDFLKSVEAESLDNATKDLAHWISEENISGSKILDIGSGSGIHSLGFLKLGAAEVFSFDYDINSVNATTMVWEKAGRPSQWKVTQGSVLDPEFMNTIAPADIVYSWGVLHHTGNMWQAIENAARLVKPGGLFFISIYAKGPRYPADLALKRKYNASSALGKKWMTWQYIWRKIIRKRLRKFQNPFTWNEKKERGMNVYHDVVDWLGGLPYEVAYEEEITDFLAAKGFEVQKKLVKGEGACHRLLYRKTQIKS